MHDKLSFKTFCASYVPNISFCVLKCLLSSMWPNSNFTFHRKNSFAGLADLDKG